MLITSSLLTVIFHLTTFGILTVRIYTLFIRYAIPYLRTLQTQLAEKWYHLQEEHAVLITKKKRLATQFLQQEKQLALLSSKLEKWYDAWKARHKKHVAFFEKQNEKIANRYVQQQERVVDAQHAKQLSAQIVAEIRAEITDTALSAHRERFLHDSLRSIDSINPPKES